MLIIIAAHWLSVYTITVQSLNIDGHLITPSAAMKASLQFKSQTLGHRVCQLLRSYILWCDYEPYSKIYTHPNKVREGVIWDCLQALIYQGGEPLRHLTAYRHIRYVLAYFKR